MSTDSQTSSAKLAWIENGILYNEYHTRLTLTDVLETEKASLSALGEHNIQILPVIVFLIGIKKSDFKLSFADYARVLCTFDIGRHASGVWIIGVPEEVKETILMISNYFAVHRIFFADSVKEAQEAAESIKYSTQSILDRE
jgi:hypothetical protein